MYQKIVYLSQQSPYIHFQNDLPGATLRATDVKPRLDKYLFKQLGEIKKEWINTTNGGNPNFEEKVTNVDTPSLNYKLSILASGHTFDVIPKLYPCYFGNTGTKENDAIKKKFAFTKSVKLVFKSYYKDLLNLIVANYIKDFFVAHNFGTRSGKGFGSFVVVPAENANVGQSEYEDNLRLQFIAVFKFSKQIFGYDDYTTQHKSLFNKIDEAYKELKSGLQRSPSKLRKYFNAMNPSVEWEKGVTLEKLNKHVDDKLRVDKLHNNVFYIRALLGLAENYEYEKIRTKSKFKISDKAQEIERFPSPILVKVYQNTFYFCISESAIISLNKIAGETFQFELYKGEDKLPSGNFEIKVPDIGSFDLVKFLGASLSSEKWKKIK